MVSDNGKGNLKFKSNADFEKMKLKAYIEAYKQIRSIIEKRIEEMEKALNKQNMKTIEYPFNPPISIEDRKIKWMEAKILEPHRKHGLKWRFKFTVGTNLAEKLQLTVPYNFDEKNLEEIKRIVKRLRSNGSKGSTYI